MDLFTQWHNHRRPRMSLGVNVENETPPARSYVRCLLEEKPWLTDRQWRNTIHLMIIMMRRKRVKGMSMTVILHMIHISDLIPYL